MAYLVMVTGLPATRIDCEDQLARGHRSARPRSGTASRSPPRGPPRRRASSRCGPCGSRPASARPAGWPPHTAGRVRRTPGTGGGPPHPGERAAGESCRLTSCEVTTIAASWSSGVTTYCIAIRWRSSSDTSRHELTLMCLPDPVDHTRSRARVPVAEVEDTSVLRRPCRRQVQRLVVDVELQHGGVRHVDDRLPGARQAVRRLGVRHRPGLVETGDERARRPGRSALVKRAADPEVAVAQREHRLRPRRVALRPAGLDQTPVVGREQVLRGRHHLPLEHGTDGSRDVIPRT